MCVYSMIVDHKIYEWERRGPWLTYPDDNPVAPYAPTVSAITPEEIEEFRRLLNRAREYDKANNQKDCEMEEKKEKLKKLAEELGVVIDFA
jgi:hypothetical protein